MANMSFEEILTQITQISKKYGIEHLYLFGSYASGTAAPSSDIDIIIKGGHHIRQFREEIDMIKTLKKIDIFEYDRCRNKYLKEDMDKYGQQIY